MGKTYDYILCGWHTRSSIPLTRVPTFASDGGDADIIIRVGEGQPSTSPEPRLCSAQRWPIRILVWPSPTAAQKDIEIFLLGQAWGVLCHQRRILPLHASAILTGNCVTAFAGDSGTGKSTTAALMSLLGYDVVADDILPISFDQQFVPGAWPYLRRLKLAGGDLDEVIAGPTEPVSENLDKERFFFCPQSGADDAWRRLERVLLLEIDDSLSFPLIDRVAGAEAVQALVEHTYNFHYVLESGGIPENFALCTEIASKVGIYRLRRPPSPRVGTEIVELIRDHFGLPYPKPQTYVHPEGQGSASGLGYHPNTV
jgi:hypothetical protein